MTKATVTEAWGQCAHRNSMLYSPRRQRRYREAAMTMADLSWLMGSGEGVSVWIVNNEKFTRRDSVGVNRNYETKRSSILTGWSL